MLCTIKPSFFLDYVAFQAVARLTDFEKEFYKVCSYVDGCHLPENCKLKLEEMRVEDRMPLPGLQTQYRLKPAEHCEREVFSLVSFCYGNIHKSTSQHILLHHGDEQEF